MQISCETLPCVIIHAFLCVLSVTKKSTTNFNRRNNDSTDTLLRVLIFCSRFKGNLNNSGSRVENQKSLYDGCKKKDAIILNHFNFHIYSDV